MKIVKRLTAMLLILVLLLPGFTLAEDDVEVEEVVEEEAVLSENEDSGDEAVTEKDGWHFDAKGFLAGENPGNEYLLEDEENGIWQYASKDLSVKVTRYREQTKKKNRILTFLKTKGFILLLDIVAVNLAYLLALHMCRCIDTYEP